MFLIGERRGFCVQRAADGLPDAAEHPSGGRGASGPGRPPAADAGQPDPQQHAP